MEYSLLSQKFSFNYIPTNKDIKHENGNEKKSISTEEFKLSVEKKLMEEIEEFKNENYEKKENQNKEKNKLTYIKWKREEEDLLMFLKETNKNISWKKISVIMNKNIHNCLYNYNTLKQKYKNQRRNLDSFNIPVQYKAEIQKGNLKNVPIYATCNSIYQKARKISNMIDTLLMKFYRLENYFKLIKNILNTEKEVTQNINTSDVSQHVELVIDYILIQKHKIDLLYSFFKECL